MTKDRNLGGSGLFFIFPWTWRSLCRIAALHYDVPLQFPFAISYEARIWSRSFFNCSSMRLSWFRYRKAKCTLLTPSSPLPFPIFPFPSLFFPLLNQIPFSTIAMRFVACRVRALMELQLPPPSLSLSVYLFLSMIPLLSSRPFGLVHVTISP